MEHPANHNLYFGSDGLNHFFPALCRGTLIFDQAISKQDSRPAPDVAWLTSQMARGDENAYRRFYEMYFNRLLGYLLVLTRDEEVAREALQMTLLRVARYAKKFDSEQVFWSWLTV